MIRLWNNNYTAPHGLVKNKSEKLAKEDEMSVADLMEDQKYYEMIYHGKVEDGALPLGQSIGAINSIENVKDIIETTVNEAELHLKKAHGYIN